MNKNPSIIYFSPTNGTKNAINLLAKQISSNYTEIDLTNPKKRETTYKFNENSLIIVAAPVYMGQLPLVDGLFNNLKGNNTPCVIMASYGNRHYDDTLAQMKYLLENQGFICIGAITSIIPHIYSEKLGLNRPDTIDLNIFKEFSTKLFDKLNNISSVILPGKSTPSIPKGKSSVIKYLNKSKCTNCMICAKECPTTAISFDTLDINSEICINCMRCSKVCINNARTFDCSTVKNYLESNYLRRREIEYFL